MPLAQPHGPPQPGLHPGDGQRAEPGLRHELRDQNPGPAPTPYPPDDPRHPDHTLLLQIRGIVRTRTERAQQQGAHQSQAQSNEALSLRV